MSDADYALTPATQPRQAGRHLVNHFSVLKGVGEVASRCGATAPAVDWRTGGDVLSVPRCPVCYAGVPLGVD